ncbi:hypothetical protein KUCAC02_011539, partial [Chaenocephalus aceratus]
MAGVEDTMRAAVPSWWRRLGAEMIYRRTNYIHEMSCEEVGLFCTAGCAAQASTEMERRSQNCSSDSVGSDGVFMEESHYQGMLRNMDHRKDERDRVQKKTFTKWVNKHLMKKDRGIVGRPAQVSHLGSRLSGAPRGSRLSGAPRGSRLSGAPRGSSGSSGLQTVRGSSGLLGLLWAPDCQGLLGAPRGSSGSSGLLRAPLGSSGLLGAPQGSSGLLRAPDCQGLLGAPRAPLGSRLSGAPRGSSGLLWAPDCQGLLGAPRGSSGSSGLLRAPQGSSGLLGAPQGSSGLLRAPRGSSGLLGAPRGSSGLQTGSSGSSGLLGAPRGSSGSSGHLRAGGREAPRLNCSEFRTPPDLALMELERVFDVAALEAFWTCGHNSIMGLTFEGQEHSTIILGCLKGPSTSQRHITDLYEDLRDGHSLISLLEVLSGDTLPRERDVVRNVRLVSGAWTVGARHGMCHHHSRGEKGRMRFHKLQNVQIALDFLKHRQVPISDIQVNGQSDDMTAKEKLLLWSQRMVEGYQGLRCDNFTTGWRDGKLFNAVIHKHREGFHRRGVLNSASSSTAGSASDLDDRVVMLCEDIPNESSFDSCRGSTGPGARSGRGSRSDGARPEQGQTVPQTGLLPTLIDMGKVYRQSNQENLEQAFSVAERDLGVTRLLDPEDVDVLHPDEKSIITYVSSLYDAMPRVPDVQEGVKANELELRWQEYYELVTMLLQWIRHHIMVFEERKFPNSYEEIEVLWRQFLKFKETELPAKESDKNRSKHIFNSFEGAVQAGVVKVPPGYHPFDVEKEWGRLHVAILERERLLRKEFERLEQLQRVVSKVQMESGVCEEQLNQVETLLQMDMRTMNSGKPAQHTAEMEADLEKAEGMIRFLFNDVQLLKDGRHLQAEQMYRRVYRLHERLVNLRSEYNLRLKSGVTTSQIPMTQIHTSQIPMTQIHTSQIPMTQVHTAQVTTLQQAPMRVRPELDEVTMRYIQDLLGWVEENQRRVDDGQWGSDLPTVESQLGSHRGLHQSVEEFHSKIQRAKADESQISPASKGAYRDYLGKLELQYGKLLNASKARLHSLDQLHAFVIAATKELIERNTNMTAKKDNYSGLMRDLELREKKVNVVQATGDKLLRDGHPARKTVEAFTGALQTQWSWLLQLCCCVETHLKENTAHYQFFSDVKEAEDKIKKMQDTMKRKYTCDRSVTVTRLEDLLQDAADDKEQLTEFQTHLEGLKRRAKTIIQLKPRNPATAIKGKQPVQAVCDFKQMEITVHRGDECALLNNSQPYKWRVLNDKGNESSVPSICFLVPPTNKDAVNSVAGLDGNLQRLHTMWQNMFLDMKSMLSYQYLMRDIHIIKTWNVTMFKTLRVEEYRLALRNLELHYQDFLRDSQDSETFGAEDRMQVESNYNKANQHYNTMVSSAEQGYVPPRAGEQDESVCKTYLTQIKDLRLRLEGCENRTVTRLRQPVDKEPLKACAMKTAEQMKVQSELEGLKKDLNAISEKTEEVLASPQQTSSAPMLRSELDVTLRKMDHVYGLSSVYLDKLKTINVVIRNTQEAEDALKTYESRLLDVNKVPENEKEVEEQRSQLKSMRAEVEADQVIFDRLQDELRKASTINDKMTRIHSERDAELEHYRQLVSSLLERWQVVFAQMDMRQRELNLLGRHMNSYNVSYEWLIHWLGEARTRQEKIQAVPIGGSKALREQLAEEKILLEEIEKNKDKIDSCQKNAKAYIDSVKDYELQILTYKALQDPMASPLKKPKMDCASDNIIQEYVTLRTRYSELMTLTSQYIKFITETQRRLEDDE